MKCTSTIINHWIYCKMCTLKYCTFIPKDSWGWTVDIDPWMWTNWNLKCYIVWWSLLVEQKNEENKFVWLFALHF